jgi:hypothetical protein
MEYRDTIISERTGKGQNFLYNRSSCEYTTQTMKRQFWVYNWRYDESCLRLQDYMLIIYHEPK